MTSEALPKYMLLHEDSEEMRDKRICTIKGYLEVGDGVQRTTTKRINNTIPLTDTLYSTGIYNLAYSNTHGLLLIAYSKGVAMTSLAAFEAQLLTGKQQSTGKAYLDLTGDLFLSPSNEVLAICNESIIQFTHTALLPTLDAAPLPNTRCHQRYLWVNDTTFIGWRFEGQVFVYHLSKNLSVQSQTDIARIPEVSCATAVSLVSGHLIICEKRLMKVFNSTTFDHLQTHNLELANDDSIYFQYSEIVEVFKINVHDQPGDLKKLHSAPSAQDIFGLVMVYYDDDEEAPDERYLSFFRGNILTPKHEMRGNEMFYTTKQSRELYYQEGNHLGFACKAIYSGHFITVQLEKTEIIYVVDPMQNFDKLNVFAVESKHELKEKDGKFFQGLALMNNMLEAERRCPQDGDELVQQIVKKYRGEFLTMYFQSKETNLNVAFPQTVLALGGGKLYRRYAISSVGGIEKDKNEEIVAEMEKIKKSPYVFEVKSPWTATGKGVKAAVIKSTEDLRDGQKNGAEEPKPAEKKPANNPFVQIGSAAINKKEDEKQTNPFGQIGATLNKNEEKKPANSLFGQFVAAPSTQSGPFGLSTMKFPGSQGKSKSPFDSAGTPPLFPNLFANKDLKTPPPSQTTPPIFGPFGPSSPILGSLLKSPVTNISSAPPTAPPASNSKQEVTSSSKDETKSKAPQTTPPVLAASGQSNPAFGSIKPTGINMFSAFSSALPSAPTALSAQNILDLNLFRKQAATTTIKQETTTQKQEEKEKNSNSLGTAVSVNPVKSQIIRNIPPQQNSPAPPSAQSIKQEVKSKTETVLPYEPITTYQKQPIKPTLTPPPPTPNNKISLIQSIKFKIVQQKARLNQIQTQNRDQKTFTLKNCQKLAASELNLLKGVDKKLMGLSLSELSQWINTMKDVPEQYDRIFSRDPSLKTTQKQLQDGFEKQSATLNRMLYYSNLLSHKNKNNKSNMKSSILSSNNNQQQKVINSATRITDNNGDRVRNLTHESSELVDKVEALLQEVSKRTDQSKLNKRKRQSKTYNFHQFTAEDEVPTAPKNQSRLKTNPTQIISNSITIKFADIDPTPKLELAALQPKQQLSSMLKKQSRVVEAPKEVALPKKKSEDNFVNKIPQKREEKVVVPNIRDSSKEMKQKQAVSELADSEHSSLEDDLDIPIATRQISFIQPDLQNKIGPKINPGQSMFSSLPKTKASESPFNLPKGEADKTKSPTTSKSPDQKLEPPNPKPPTNTFNIAAQAPSKNQKKNEDTDSPSKMQLKPAGQTKQQKKQTPLIPGNPKSSFLGGIYPSVGNTLPAKTIIFGNNPNKNASPLTASFGSKQQPKQTAQQENKEKLPNPEEKKKQAPANIFPTGNVFGNINPFAKTNTDIKPKETVAPPPKQTQEDQKKANEETIPLEASFGALFGSKSTANKPETQNTNKRTSPLGDALIKRAQTSTTETNPIPAAPSVIAPPIPQNKAPSTLTTTFRNDAEQQSNLNSGNTSTLLSNSNAAGNPPNVFNPPNSPFNAGMQQAVFGGGNRFMKQQPPKTQPNTGFDPNAASFQFGSGNTQLKTFGGFSGLGKPKDNNTNMFSQSSQSSQFNQQNNNPFPPPPAAQNIFNQNNNNQGMQNQNFQSNIFAGQQQQQSFSPNNNNMFGNQPSNPPSFNQPNMFNNSNQAPPAFNMGNSANQGNMYNQGQSPFNNMGSQNPPNQGTNIFNSNNNNSGTNFLAGVKLGQSPMAHIPDASKAHLMQPRK